MRSDVDVVAVTLRVPASLRDHLAAAAAARRRSMNAEAIVRLENSLSAERNDTRASIDTSELVTAAPVAAAGSQ